MLKIQPESQMDAFLWYTRSDKTANLQGTAFQCHHISNCRWVLQFPRPIDASTLLAAGCATAYQATW